MSSPDPLDGTIRQAVTELVSHAPPAPDFDDLEPPGGRWLRPGLLVGLALGFVVVIAAGALAARDDTTVTTGTADTSTEPEEADDASTPCEQQAASVPAEVNVFVFLRPEATDAERDAVLRTLEAAPAVERLWFRDEEYVYAEFQRLFADQPEILESVTPEILPTHVDLHVDAASPGELVQEMLSAHDAVREVLSGDLARSQMAAACAQGDGSEQVPPTTLPTSADGTVVRVELWHCGVRPVDFVGRRWLATSEIDGTTAPGDFGGTGTMQLLSESEAVYVDAASGASIEFAPLEGEYDPPPCA